MAGHTLLHIIDIHKDAFPSNCPIDTEIGYKLFRKCMKRMFGKKYIPEDYNRIINKTRKYTNNTCQVKPSFIQQINENTNVIPPIPLQILKKPSIPDYNTLPSHITHSIRDAGPSPQLYNKNIKNLLTPGSYIDPGKRSNKSAHYGKILMKGDYIKLQIPFLQGIYSIYDKNIKGYHIMIDFLFYDNIKQTLNIKAYSSSKREGDGVEYFMGNSVKNTWFNNQKEINEETIKKGIIYLVCKLMGDLLQVYYGHLFNNDYRNYGKLACIFTIDRFVKFRSQFFDTPVVISTYEKKNNYKYQSLYYPSSRDLTEDLVQPIFNEVTTENNEFMRILHTVIQNKGFYIAEEKIQLNPKIRNYFESMISLVSDVNTKILHILRHMKYTYYDFIKMARTLKVNHIFDRKGSSFYLCSNVNRLFSESDEDDIIYSYNTTIQDILYSMKNIKDGGSDYKKSNIIFKDMLQKYRKIMYEDEDEEQYTKDSLWKLLVDKLTIILKQYFINDVIKDREKTRKMFSNVPGVIHPEDPNEWTIENHSIPLHASFIASMLKRHFENLGLVYLEDTFLYRCIPLYWDCKLSDLKSHEFKSMFDQRQKELGVKEYTWDECHEPDFRNIVEESDEEEYLVPNYSDDDSDDVSIYEYNENREIWKNNEKNIVSNMFASTPSRILQTAGKTRNKHQKHKKGRTHKKKK